MVDSVGSEPEYNCSILSNNGSYCKIGTTVRDRSVLGKMHHLVDQSSFPVNEPEQGSEANRESSLTRRALLKAGWAVPVILAVGLPSTVLAGATSPSSHHHDKPKGHFDIWPKKKHWPDFDKKKHWPDDDKKKDSHHYDRLWW
jgi:hypothetical protein